MERREIQILPNHTIFPLRSVGKLIAYKYNSSPVTGTAVMINNNQGYTAYHNMFDILNQDKKGYNKPTLQLDGKQYLIDPKHMQIIYHQPKQQLQKDYHKHWVIKFWLINSINQDNFLQVPKDITLLDTQIYLYGFPKTFQMERFRSNAYQQDHIIIYDLPTEKGMSGGPVVILNGKINKFNLIGIHQGKQQNRCEATSIIKSKLIDKYQNYNQFRSMLENLYVLID